MVDKDTPKSEQRNTQRMGAEHVFVAMNVLGLQGSDQAFGIVKNVSEDGMCITTPQPPPGRSSVEIRVNVCEEVHTISGGVRWVRRCDRAGNYEVGIEFSPADRGRMMFLESFLGSDHRLDSRS